MAHAGCDRVWRSQFMLSVDLEFQSPNKKARILRYPQCDVPADALMHTWIAHFPSGNHDKGFINPNLWSICHINNVTTPYIALDHREA